MDFGFGPLPTLDLLAVNNPAWEAFGQTYASPDYILPIKSKITRMTTTKPKPPLG